MARQVGDRTLLEEVMEVWGVNLGESPRETRRSSGTQMWPGEGALGKR